MSGAFEKWLELVESGGVECSGLMHSSLEHRSALRAAFEAGYSALMRDRRELPPIHVTVPVARHEIEHARGQLVPPGMEYRSLKELREMPRHELCTVPPIPVVRDPLNLTPIEYAEVEAYRERVKKHKP